MYDNCPCTKCILEGQGRALLEECIAKQTYVAFCRRSGAALDWPGIKRTIVTTLHAKQDVLADADRAKARHDVR